MDEKTQIQALDRTQPLLPLRPGQVERRTHDYKRQGTTSLFDALELKTHKVIAQLQHQQHFSLEDSLAASVDRMQRNFGPLKQQVEWPSSALRAILGRNR